MTDSSAPVHPSPPPTIAWVEVPVQAAAASLAVLQANAGKDWTRLADTDRTCRSLIGHIALSVTLYAGQLIVRPTDHTAGIAAGSDPYAPVPVALEAIGISATFLSWAVARSSPEDRAFHSWGTSDAAGFAAMAGVEILVHTFDITRSLGVEWMPPDTLSAPILGRLFPHAPSGHAPGSSLLWSTGRIALPGLPQKPRGAWQWQGTVDPARR